MGASVVRTVVVGASVVGSATFSNPAQSNNIQFDMVTKYSLGQTVNTLYYTNSLPVIWHNTTASLTVFEHFAEIHL